MTTDEKMDEMFENHKRLCEEKGKHYANSVLAASVLAGIILGTESEEKFNEVISGMADTLAKVFDAATMEDAMNILELYNDAGDISIHEAADRYFDVKEPAVDLTASLNRLSEGRAERAEQIALSGFVKGLMRNSNRFNKVAFLCDAFNAHCYQCPFYEDGKCYFLSHAPSDYRYPEIDRVLNRYSYKDLAEKFHNDEGEENE